MAAPESSREPCPDRILDDLGAAFAMGALGGSIFHFGKGIINSPRGGKFLGGMQTMSMYAPRTGGSFAVWGGLFSVFDCGIVYVRQKEDPWNSVLAGAATGGFLQVRHGLKATARSAVVAGVLLGMVEGAVILSNRLFTPTPGIVYDEQGLVGGHAAGSGYPVYGAGCAAEEVKQGGVGWFGGLFGKAEDKGSGSESETKVLENFDTPTPMPTFDYK